MTVQQTFATMGRSTVPLIAPAIVADLGVDPALVGIYVAIGAVAGFLTTMGCGGLIVRFGALRMTQVGMEPVGSTPEQFEAFVRAEIEKWSKVVKASGAHPD